MNAKVASRLDGRGHACVRLGDGLHGLAGLEPDLRRRQPAQQVDARGCRQSQADNDQTQPDGQPILGRVP